MSILEQCRKQLFEKLLSLDYFKNEAITIEEFSKNLDDEEKATTLYQNLAKDGVFNNEEGKIVMTEQLFKTAFGGYRQPSTPTEKTIFNGVSEILNTQDFGIDSNLYTLGLTSLTAIKLSALIEKDYAVKVTVAQISEYPSVVELANYVDSNIKSATKGNPLA